MPFIWGPTTLTWRHISLLVACQMYYIDSRHRIATEISLSEAVLWQCSPYVNHECIIRSHCMIVPYLHNTIFTKRGRYTDTDSRPLDEEGLQLSFVIPHSKVQFRYNTDLCTTITLDSEKCGINSAQNGLKHRKKQCWNLSELLNLYLIT